MSTMRLLCILVAILASAARPGKADLAADFTLQNSTGVDKTDWPVILAVYKVFGADLDPTAINPQGFHVIDANGEEIPHMIRRIPPDFSPGNDEIVFVLPTMKANQRLSFRLTNTKAKGRTQAIDLAGNPNNLLPGGGFETIAKGCPDGYEVQAGRNVEVVPDLAIKHSGRQSLRLTIPVGSTLSLRTAQPVRFHKDRLYHFSFWARTESVAYTGWGFWNDGATVGFEPVAFPSRNAIPLRGTRDWYCYSAEPGDPDGWGVPAMACPPQAEKVKKDGKEVTADLWQKRGEAVLTIKARQANQSFLKDDKTGRIWLDEMLLLEQPLVTVDRVKPLRHIASEGAVLFSRPVNMPRMGAFSHEAAEKVETFAMAGERRQIRVGVCAIRDLRDVRLDVTPLLSPDGQTTSLKPEIEFLGEYVEPYAPIATLPAGKTAEFLLGIAVPTDAKAGVYGGTIAFRTGEKILGRMAVKFEVLPFGVPAMQPYLVGGIFNTGMGLSRNKDLYRCYARTGFNYILLFDYLFRWQGGQFNFSGADRQVDEITKVAGVRDAIGLYREPNMSEDQPRLWYQIASGKPDYEGAYKNGVNPDFEREYKELARQADVYARDHHWPKLVYMVSDEPSDKRDVDPSMGWLKEAMPEAVSLADVQFKDMLNTWQWYSLPVFDDPIDWTGPLVYEWVKGKGRTFGFCGTGWGLERRALPAGADAGLLRRNLLALLAPARPLRAQGQRRGPQPHGGSHGGRLQRPAVLRAAPAADRRLQG